MLLPFLLSLQTKKIHNIQYQRRAQPRSITRHRIGNAPSRLIPPLVCTQAPDLLIRRALILIFTNATDLNKLNFAGRDGIHRKCNPLPSDITPPVRMHPDLAVYWRHLVDVDYAAV